MESSKDNTKQGWVDVAHQLTVNKKPLANKKSPTIISVNIHSGIRYIRICLQNTISLTICWKVKRVAANIWRWEIPSDVANQI